MLFSCLKFSFEIYVPENEQQYKPVYTSGIKTISYQRPSQIEYHHNYSKVNHHGYQRNNFDQEEEPYYNAHFYGNRPSEHLTQVYILNGTRIGRNENPVRQIALYNKKKERSQMKPYKSCPFNATGQFIYAFSCNQFLNCWKGRGYVQTCAPGTLFNPTTLECDFPEKVECVSGPRLSVYQPEKSSFVSQIGCPQEFSGLIPNYTDCSKFINCVSGIENFMTCPAGTLFDVDKNICDFAHKARCFNGENNRIKQENVKGKLDFTDSGLGRRQSLTYKSNEIRCPQNVDGLHTHPTDCSKFLNCDRGRTYIQDCPPGTLFNPGIKICDFPYNVRCQNTLNQVTTSRYTEIPVYRNHHSDTGTGTNHLADNFNTYQNNYNNQYDHFGSGRDSKNYDNQYYDQNKGRFPYQTTQKTYGLDQESYYGQQSRNIEPNRRVPTYGVDNHQNYWIQNWNTQRPSYGQDSWSKDTYTNQQPLLGNVGSNNFNRNIYNPSDWNSNQYYQRPNSYGTEQYPVYVNRDTSPNQRHDFGFNSSNNYGHSNWGHSQGNINSRYDSNKPVGTYGQNNWNLNRHHQNTYNQEPYYDGPDAIVRQRGESGYNRFNNQNGWPQETFTPNYDQVVHINHNTYNYRTTKPPYRKPHESVYGRTTTSRSVDYEDTVGIGHHTKPMIRETTPRILERHWPPPFPSTDVNADYVFDYDDNDFVTLKAENSIRECGKNEFYCSLQNCISKMLLCNGIKNCPNGEDELNCLEYVSKYSVRKDHKLAVLEKERWDNVSIAACAWLCTETRRFQCRSFNYRKVDKTCFLTDTNEGLTGALISYYPFDYYEAINEKIDCSRRFICSNKKCIDRSRLCDGVDDCGDRLDEKGCKPEDFGYRIRLTGSKQHHQQQNEGHIEVTAFGKSGYVCDDNFGLRDADVVCRELGFGLGALEVKKNAYYEASRNPFFMMDDVNCSGNETRLMDCDFSGWGVHNCLGQEIAGVVCKTPQEKCPSDYWQCETRQECLPLAFVCDGLLDCSDGSDEKSQHCDSPTQIRLVNGTNRQEGRVEIKHHGTWGTICDDDFNEEAAKVICRYLGYKGSASVRKEAYFGSGHGPIWLDQVFCSGNETRIEDCSHWNWGEHNCEHSEDVGVICSNIYEHERHSVIAIPKIPATYPHRCGYRKDNIFNRDDDVHFRVVRGSLAKRGDYPWQAAIRVKGKTSSPKTVNHWCGAVIISEKFVLTAAHCLMGYPKGAYVVVAGDYDVDEDEGTEQEVYIEDFYIHKRFREGHKMNNDIALVKLKGRGFRFNDDIQPICLPDNSTEYEAELNCTISGFGSIQSGKSAFSHQLRAGWIPIQKREICTMPHVYGDAITEGMICAGSLDEGTDACDGDSGGPLACLKEEVFTLYGITSWGQHCGYANKPGVYVKVAHYRKWIDDIFYKHLTN